MDLRVSTCFVMLTYCFWYGDARDFQLEELVVPNGGQWGLWGDHDICKEGYANGFALKTEEYQGSASWLDDTGLNGIRIYCSKGYKATSSFGKWGTWSKPKFCHQGFLIAFRLQVEPPQGSIYDDTAANNIIFECNGSSYMKGEGHDWGNLVHGANVALPVPYVGFRQR